MDINKKQAKISKNIQNRQNKQWIKKWENNQIAFHQNEINVYLKKYINIFDNKNNCVFVPFCGKSLDMLYLSKNVNVVGVELVKSALDIFLTENNLLANIEPVDDFLFYDVKNDNKNIQLWCGDFFNLETKHIQTNKTNQIDIFDRASLVALEECDRARYSKKIIEFLGKKAKMLLVSIYYEQSQKQGPPYSVSPKEIYKLYGDVCNIELLETLDLKQTSDRYDHLSYIDESVYLITPK